MLIIDYSSSQFPFIETSIAAAKALVDKLPSSDSMATVTDDVEVIQDFTRDKQKLKSKLDLIVGPHHTKRHLRFSGSSLRQEPAVQCAAGDAERGI